MPGIVIVFTVYNVFIDSTLVEISMIIILLIV